MSTPALQMSLFSVGTEENLLPLTSSLTPITFSEASVGVGAAVFAVESRSMQPTMLSARSWDGHAFYLPSRHMAIGGKRLPPSLSACNQPGQPQIQNDCRNLQPSQFILSEISG